MTNPENSSASTGDSFTGSGMHPEVTYTVRIDGVYTDIATEITKTIAGSLATYPCCRTCKYGEFPSETDNLGKCRRNSPVPDTELGTAKWPIVAWNDWCGDWSNK